ncbi:glycoside hydrolase family 27 protein [Nocardia alni]|uniref:glycoside hydrolase family 27 protein n=1 Tax=Nocardia alni TaxID=2815723 RepID=UPI0027E01A11|nr:glycoside hydrolase family 27 protein [Nocardia alni]
MIRHSRWAGILVAFATAACLLPVSPAAAEPELSGPPMGWNSWNSGIALNEKNIEQTIDAMVASGMRDAGYRYVNLDAGWAAATRDANGDLRADPTEFPHGIAALARYAHERGMLLGLYSSPYNETCGQTLQNASAGHEAQDARTFAAWGVDYLKYDWCRDTANLSDQVRKFTAMRDALRATGRHIVYSINPNSASTDTAGAYDWSRISDVTRNAHDLFPLWHNTLPTVLINDLNTRQYLGVTDQVAAAAPLAARSRPGHWNDPDMLVVGEQLNEFLGAHLGTLPGAVLKTLPLSLQQQIADRSVLKKLTAPFTLSPQQLTALRSQQVSLTPDEQRTHFSLWAMLSAPLIAGNDIRTMSAQIRDLLANREVIAVDQDPAAVQGAFLPTDDRVMTKRLSDGSIAVALLNRGAAPADISTTASALGLPAASCYTVRNLWTHTTSATTGLIDATGVASHAATMLRLTPRCG